MLSRREDAELCCNRPRIILIILVDENLLSEDGPILVVGARNGPPKYAKNINTVNELHH